MPRILACGMRAAHKAGVQHSRQHHVADEAPAAGKQDRIFEARDTGAEMLRAHGRISSHCAGPRSPTRHRKDCIAIGDRG